MKNDKPHSRGCCILVRSCATPPGICQENMFSLGGVAQPLEFMTLLETCTMQQDSVFEWLLRRALLVAPAVGCSFQSSFFGVSMSGLVCSFQSWFFCVSMLGLVCSFQSWFSLCKYVGFSL